jgi:hypothetical protein
MTDSDSMQFRRRNTYDILRIIVSLVAGVTYLDRNLFFAVLWFSTSLLFTFILLYTLIKFPWHIKLTGENIIIRKNFFFSRAISWDDIQKLDAMQPYTINISLKNGKEREVILSEIAKKDRDPLREAIKDYYEAARKVKKAIYPNLVKSVESQSLRR